MKNNLIIRILSTFILAAALPTAQAQEIKVDRTKYPDYSDEKFPDWSLMSPVGTRGGTYGGTRPDHINNAETRYFPPVFNQDGGSCSAASRISYMFSYELAAYRDLDASQPENYYPSHFIWLHINSPGSYIANRNNFITKVGVPSAADYGGQTYSSLFGFQEANDEDFGWMQGYDKWYRAMHNRMQMPINFPMHMGTPEGREALKNWLWNHNGDGSFHAGGICGVDVAASDGMWTSIPQSETNDKLGVTGMYQVQEWGTMLDHSVTIVGYDDRIEFDINKNGIVGEREADEVGAWIIVNSWGNNWCNDGFVYCPYAFSGVNFNGDVKGDRTFNTDSWWWPEVYRVEKDYRPLRTIKLKMDYSHRSEIALSAGVSDNLNATQPDKIVAFEHFTYAGDGNYGRTNPAPQVPMLGRWADGRLHTEPMEFGYDLTALTNGYDTNKPLKYFFIVDSRSWAVGKGTIHEASIIDYAYDLLGEETPFALGDGVEIQNEGNRTIISVITNGNIYHAPQNITYKDGTLAWQAPIKTANEVASYNIYFGNTLIDNVDGTVLSHDNNTTSGEYSITAVYADGNESAKISIATPVEPSQENMGVNFFNSGFTIPGVFDTKYQQATIEYWIKPNTLYDWNQSGGPGWGKFMFHANRNRQLTVGWDTTNRIFSKTLLNVGTWTHVAIVIDGNRMALYVNGVFNSEMYSSDFSGLGGFGDFTFSSNGTQNSQDATYDEIRIWNTARTEEEINSCKDIEFVGDIMPKNLIAYLNGNLVTDVQGVTKLQECTRGLHATLHNSNFSAVSQGLPALDQSSEECKVSINEPTDTIYAGIPTTFTASYNGALDKLVWSAESAGIDSLATVSPSITFDAAGTHTVSVKATTIDGKSATATRQVTVLPAPAIDATFSANKEIVSAGERVTFIPRSPQMGYIYEWSLPGASTEKASSVNAAVSYNEHGTYEVTLTITAPDGTKSSFSKSIEVTEVAPKAAFSITPAVVVKGEDITLTDESAYIPTEWTWDIRSDKKAYIAYDQNRTINIDEPGVYSVTLNAANNAGENSTTRERAIIVTNADSKNGLNFGYEAATVTASNPLFGNGENGCTIEWWMNANWPTEENNGIGDSENTLLIKSLGNGGISLNLYGVEHKSRADFIIPGEWHHYAVCIADYGFYLMRDGVIFETKELKTERLPQLNNFRIGGASTPFKGSIDEFRVWSRTFNEAQIRNYINAPIEDVSAAESDNLILYYNFNQSGGNVQDATSYANHGVRSGFGPDGDAWGLSKGVFCLNFNDNTKDITKDYLENYKKSFKDNSTCINPNLPTRTFGLVGWEIENAIVNGNIITGAHVDKAKSSTLTVTTNWDNFASSLTDHKVYQTITLPAGHYTFTAMYDTYYEGQCGSSYLVVAEGETLPITMELDNAIAHMAMKPKGTVSSNKVEFVLKEETTISIGLLVNMSGSSCMTIQQFSLTQSDITIFDKIDDATNITSITNDVAPKGVYDLTGRLLRSGNSTLGLTPGIYIVDGRKVLVR